MELVQRKKGFRPQANTSTRTKSTQDRRKADERKHPGTTRPAPPLDEGTVQPQEVTADVCPDCQGGLLEAGEFIEQIFEDILDDSDSGRVCQPAVWWPQWSPRDSQKRRDTARIRLTAFNTLNTHDWQRLRFTLHSENQQW